jgi:hypothetical protein
MAVRAVHRLHLERARYVPRHGGVTRGEHRDFVPWRFSDAGCQSAWLAS